MHRSTELMGTKLSTVAPAHTGAGTGHCSSYFAALPYTASACVFEMDGVGVAFDAGSCPVYSVRSAVPSSP